MRKRTAAALGVAESADALKKATDRAARYAGERDAARRLTGDPDLALREKEKLAQPDAAGVKPTEAFTAEPIFGDVNPLPPLVVREFAAPRPSLAPLSDDADAPDTVLWQPVIVLPADGKAVLTFTVGAAPGGYEVVIAGHTADGRLGATRGMILVTPPKTVVPNTPGGAIPPANPVAPPPPPMP
jgi:hypothetical protein